MSCFVLISFLLVSTGLAAQLKWTGDGPNNLFDESTNWQPVQVPSQGDDLVISGSFANVLLGRAQPIYVNSLTISNSAYLTIRSPLYATANLQVTDTAGVFVDSGDGEISAGNADITSSTPLYITTGVLRGLWTFDTVATLNINGSNPIHVDTLVIKGNWFLNGFSAVIGYLENSGNVYCSFGTLTVVQAVNNGNIHLGGCRVNQFSVTSGSGTVLVTEANQNGQLVKTYFYQETYIKNLQLSYDAVFTSNANLTAFTSTLISPTIASGANLIIGPGYSNIQSVDITGLTGAGTILLKSLMKVVIRKSSFVGSVICDEPTNGGFHLMGDVSIGYLEPNRCAFIVKDKNTVTKLNLTQTILNTTEGTNRTNILTANYASLDQPTLGGDVALQVATADTTQPGSLTFSGTSFLTINSIWNVYNNTIFGFVGWRGSPDVNIFITGSLIVAPGTSITSNEISIGGTGQVILQSQARIGFSQGYFDVSSVHADQGSISTSNYGRLNWNLFDCGADQTASSSWSSCSGGQCPAYHGNNQYNNGYLSCRAV